MISSPYYHFSIDDVFDALIDVSDSGLPLFEHPFFAFLDEAHRRFQIAVDLYLFVKKRIGGVERTLREVSDRLRADLELAPWIRFGPHALDYESPPYAQEPQEQERVFAETYAEIDRFAGRAQRSRWVRLHYFSEAYEIAPFFKREGTEALFLTDKPAAAYRLAEPEKMQLRERGRVTHEGLELFRSHARLELLIDEGIDRDAVHRRLERTIEEHGFFSLFTHEVEVVRPEVRALAMDCFEFFAARGIPAR